MAQCPSCGAVSPEWTHEPGDHAKLARLFAAAPKMYRMLENCAPGKGCVDPKCGCKSWAKLKAEIDGETK